MADTRAWLGLARRAGKIVAGESACLQQLQQGNVTCIVLASDAGENTSKRFRNKATYYKVPLIASLTKSELGSALGDEQRAVVVVTDTGFADRIVASVTDHSGGEGA